MQWGHVDCTGLWGHGEHVSIVWAGHVSIVQQAASNCSIPRCIVYHAGYLQDAERSAAEMALLAFIAVTGLDEQARENRARPGQLE